jgi:prophage regulatory protein
MIPTPKAAHSSQPIDAAQVPTALLKMATVVAVTGLCRANIYRKVARSEFPQPVRLSNRCTRWRAGDVAAWAAAQGTAS